jgi:glutaredoxin-like protein
MQEAGGKMQEAGDKRQEAQGGASMAILKEKDSQTIQKWFEKLRDPVRLVVFTQEHECEYCEQTRSIVEEIAALSDKITAEVYDFVDDEARAQEYGIDKIPAIAIIGSQDYGVRIYGFPGGYEFTAFAEDIIDVSTGEHGLSEATLQHLAKLTSPIHLQVFVTPT